MSIVDPPRALANILFASEVEVVLRRSGDRITCLCVLGRVCVC